MKQLKILVLARDDEFPQSVRGSARGFSPNLMLQNYKSLDEAIQSLRRLPFDAVVVDQSSVGWKESNRFYQKLRSLKNCSFLPLIVRIDAMSQETLTVASEYRFFRILSTEDKNISLRDAMEALVGELSRPSGLRTAMNRYSAEQLAGHFAEADRILEDSFQLYKDDLDVMVAYGNMCLRKGQLEKAQTVAARLSKMGSDGLRTSNFLARVYLKEGNFGAALQILDRANALSSENLDRLVLLGDVLRIQGKPERAEQAYEQALEIEPDNAPSRRGIGLTALSLGDTTRALDFFRGVVTEEETGSFFNNTAVLAVRRKNFEKAEKLYEAAYSAIGDAQLRSKVTFNQGLLFRRLARHQEAIEKFDEAYQLDKSNNKALIHLQNLGAEHSESANSGTQIANSASVDYQVDDRVPCLAILREQSSGLQSDELAFADFADSELSAAPRKSPSPPQQIVGQGIRNVEDKQTDIRPFSVQGLASQTKAKLPQKVQNGQKSGRSQGKITSSTQEVKSETPQKKVVGEGLSFFVDDEDES